MNNETRVHIFQAGAMQSPKQEDISRRRPDTQLRAGVLPELAAAGCSSLLFAATTLAGPPAQARALAHRFDIHSQDLGAALRALGAAANEQLLFTNELVVGLQSPRLKGDYSTEEALAILLEGSGLKANRTSSGVLLIRAPDSSEPKKTS